jgi:hypothetical protein
MRSFLLAAVFSLLASVLGAASAPAPAGLPSANKLPLPDKPVWEAKLAAFDEASYEKEVEALFSRFEQVSGRKLVPGSKRRVGLKVYTDSGPGMATPFRSSKALSQP